MTTILAILVGPGDLALALVGLGLILGGLAACAVWRMVVSTDNDEDGQE